MSPRSFFALLTLLALVYAGCDRRSSGTVDVVMAEDPADRKDTSDLEEAGDAAAPDRGEVMRQDVGEDVGEDAAGFDAPLDTPPDVTRDAGGEVGDAPRDRGDVEVEGLDATMPDEGAVAFEVSDGCTVARFGGPRDDGPACTPGRTRPCFCSDGRAGSETCLRAALWGACACTFTDGGLMWQDGAVAAVSAAPVPWIGRPRLLAPQSGSRATSTRPTLRWLLPAGLTRARVELCADRACGRTLQQPEVTGQTWRAAAPLAPGVVFWRVRGLDASGAAVWTSATWEFAVARRDRGVDISYGTVKDFNGDGFDDVAVRGDAFSLYWSGAGVLLYTGGPAGIAERRVLELNPPRVPFSGIDVVDRYGEYGSAFAVGDINGDGLADLTVGAPRYAEEPSFESPGRVFVYLGHRGCVAARYGGMYRPVVDDRIERFGYTTTLGDFNGDGYADLVATGDRGTAQLHLGGAGGLAEGPVDVSSISGPNAHFVGDINGDGYADVVLQHWSVYGREGLPMVVAYGNPEARLALRTQVFSPRTFPVGAFGHQARGGDFNEDGYGDVIVSGDGNVSVMYGSPDGLGAPAPITTPYEGPEIDPAGRFGGALAIADFDGDGHLELAVSQVTAPAVRDPDFRYGPGMTHFYARRAGQTVLGEEPAFSITGSPPGGIGFGWPTAPGDLNGDGSDDLTIGGNAVGPMRVGQLWVFHGGAPGWQRSPVMTVVRNYAFREPTE